MPQLSERSQQRLAECHPNLQKLFNEVIKYYDFTITEGHRPKELQDEYFRTGKSQVQWPNSKHNSTPSMAIDAVPYPVDWKDMQKFYHFVGFVMGMAQAMGIKLRSGADWNRNMNLKDQTFFDLPHFELVDDNQINEGE